MRPGIVLWIGLLLLICPGPSTATLLGETQWGARLVGWLAWPLIWIAADSCSIQGLVFHTEAATIIEISGYPGHTADLISGSTIQDNILFGWGTSDGIAESGRTGARITGNIFVALIGALRSTSRDPLIAENEFLECGPVIRLTGGGCVRGNSIHHNKTDGWDPSDGAGQGGGIWLMSAQDVTIRENEIWANQSRTGAGIYAESSNLILEQNLLWANYDSTGLPENPHRGQGGGLYAVGCTGSVLSNTFACNTAVIDGAAVVLDDCPNLAFSSNIFAFNRGEGGGLTCNGAPPQQYECNDAWDNAAVDYLGWPDPTGLDGNIGADPLFCCPDSGNFEIADESPCAETNSPAGCNLIGAFPVGCYLADAPVAERRPEASLLEVSTNPAIFPLEIRFRGVLPAQGEVSCHLYDISGREIRALPLTSGGRRGSVAIWDGTLSDGSVALAGVYFILVETGHTAQSTRVLVLR